MPSLKLHCCGLLLPAITLAARAQQTPADDPVFESTLSYSGGVVSFTAQPGYFHRLWYNHGVSNDGNGNAALLWTLLPEQVYGTGQVTAWRLHGDVTPLPGPPPVAPQTPIITRSYTLLAYNDGGTLIQWWSHALDRVQRAWVPVTANPRLDLRDLSRPANAPIRVHTGMAAWWEDVQVAGVVTARRYWSVSCIPGRNLTELQTNDYDPSEQPVLDALMGSGSAAVRTSIISRLAAIPDPPPPPPAPPEPPGITLFGDHDPQQNYRSRSLYRVERLEVDSDFDNIPDHVELANPDANGDGLPDADFDNDNDIDLNDWAAAPPASNPYDVMNAAMTGFPLSGSNNIPNAYEALSNLPNGVVINEVSLTGSDGIVDADGTEPDWIELFNPTNGVVDLTGWQLRDEGSALNWFTFPENDSRCQIPSGGYLIIVCRNSNGLVGGPNLRTSFQLNSGNGEQLELHRPDPDNVGAFLLHDQFTTGVTPRYGVLPAAYEHSFGRAMWAFHPPGGGGLTYGWFETPTPGAMNTGRWYEGFCNPVTGVTATRMGAGPIQSGVNSRAWDDRFCAFVDGGNFTNSEYVYYTLNGADPSPWSSVAVASNGLLDLSPETPFDGNDPASYDTGRGFVVRARTFKAGCVPGPVITRNFLFKEDVLGRTDDPATPGVDETEPRQDRPAGYPEKVFPGSASSITMRYGVQPAWGSAADRAAIAAQLSNAPSIALTIPVADSFDPATAGIIAAAGATEDGQGNNTPDPLGNGWERACSMQWCFANPAFGGPLLEMSAGLDVSGRTSLGYGTTLKKGFRLSFKTKYGPGKFDLDSLAPANRFSLFPEADAVGASDPDDKYDELVLRGQTGDSWTSASGGWYPSHASYSRERWAREFMEAAGHRSLKSRHIHVWINGLYWGVYMLSEVASDATLDVRERPADWQIWKDGGIVHEAPASAGGTTAADAAWRALTTQAAAMATAIQQGGTGDSEWATLQTLMDVDNFCDYVLINGYMGNWDSMWNNGRMYRDPNPEPGFDSRIRWMIYDAEMGCNSGWLQYNWAGLPGPWMQNTTTGEWTRQGWLGRTSDAGSAVVGPRGMILATTAAGEKEVTFPQQVDPELFGPVTGNNRYGSTYRLIGPGIPAGVAITKVTSIPGTTTITLSEVATATQSGVPLIHYTATTTAGALLRDLAYHPGFARRLSARTHKHFYDLRPGKKGALSAEPGNDRAITSYTARSDEFAPFKGCEYLRWGAGYSSNGSQPVNNWFGEQPAYTVNTFLPQRRGYFTTELQKHPFPPGVQPGPNPQPLYLPLEPPVLSVVAPGDPLPEGWSAVQLNPRTADSGGTNPPGTIIRYTTDGSDPSTVEFPPYSAGQVNTAGVYFVGQPNWINVPNGTVIRARTAIVDYRTAAPPQNSDSIVERIVSESTLTTLTP